MEIFLLWEGACGTITMPKLPFNFMQGLECVFLGFILQKYQKIGRIKVPRWQRCPESSGGWYRTRDPEPNSGIW